MFRTTLQCRSQRPTGETFLVGVWFSTYRTLNGPRLAAIMVDLSEDLRNREDLSFEHLLRSTRVLMSAVAHEIRNLCSAAMVIHKNLSSIDELRQNEDFQALSTVIQSLETVLARAAAVSDFPRGSVELTSVFAGSGCSSGSGVRSRRSGVEAAGHLAAGPGGRAVVQVFLNGQNSQRAMQTTRQGCA